MTRKRLLMLCAACLIGIGYCGESQHPQVINCGIPGRNSKQALSDLERQVLSKKPHHVVVYFGMNDALNSKNLQTLPAFEKNMDAIVKQLLTNGVRTVALVTPHAVIENYVRDRHPAHPQREQLQEHLERYASAVKAVAQTNKVLLIDFREALQTQGGGSSPSADCLIKCEQNGGGKDGLHLTAAGYAFLAKTVYEVLKDRVKAGETVVCFGDSLTFGSGPQEKPETGRSYPSLLQRHLVPALQGKPTARKP